MNTHRRKGGREEARIMPCEKTRLRCTSDRLSFSAMHPVSLSLPLSSPRTETLVSSTGMQWTALKHVHCQPIICPLPVQHRLSSSISSLRCDNGFSFFFWGGGGWMWVFFWGGGVESSATECNAINCVAPNGAGFSYLIQGQIDGSR